MAIEIHYGRTAVPHAQRIGLDVKTWRTDG
jgi:hypothetical protein